MNLRWKIAQAAEIRWWQNYLKKKEKADYLKWKKNYWVNFLADFGLSIQQGAKVLDAGCGPAGIFTVLEQAQVTAVDPLLDAYGAKLPHFQQAEYPNSTFVSMPLEQYKSEAHFDYIFCLNAINHVDDLALCLDNLFESLDTAGCMLLSIDAHNYPIFKRIFRLLPGDILHPHQYDLEEYKNMVTKRGGRIGRVIRKSKAFFFDYYVLEVFKN
jgi:2-polyprenyl-3-methyl-5-hydroxy-6-metoxy-1,4-benzoquinol methylase